MNTLIAALVLAPAVMAPAQMPDSMAANPIASSARMFLEEQAGAIGQAATLMPAEKYAYHPTPAQMTFGALMQHIAQTNVRLCSAIGGGAAPPPASPVHATKAALVTAVADSFKMCNAALAKLTDSQLSEVVEIAGNKVPRGYLVMTIVADWADHYSTAASYLRLNNIVPPTARQP
ncbi:MAG TPA: DinB family protein [Vicinamibacterales bacterium]|jgi:hypothetical protein